MRTKIILSFFIILFLVGCTNNKIETIDNNNQNLVSINFDTCINNTKDNPQCKDCCDCLNGVDSKIRTNCRDMCAVHDFTKNYEFITINTPFLYGEKGNYSICIEKGNSTNCKYCCENTIGLECGDYRHCRTACNNKYGDSKHNTTPQTNLSGENV